MEGVMARNKYLNVVKGSLPVLDKLQNKYNELVIFGELDKVCNDFGVSKDLVSRLAYPKTKKDLTTLNFETIIRLSNMFEIPYEDFIDYNASMSYNRNKDIKSIEEENNMLKQYQVGKQWEDEIIRYYNNKNYFVYKVPTQNNGTVFDIIAIRKGAALMIECKHITGDKLYYAGSGILKKRDEIDRFVDLTGNNLYIYVKSDITGTWWTTWVKAKPIFEKKGYICKEDCFSCSLEGV